MDSVISESLVIFGSMLVMYSRLWYVGIWYSPMSIIQVQYSYIVIVDNSTLRYNYIIIVVMIIVYIIQGQGIVINHVILYNSIVNVGIV